MKKNEFLKNINKLQIICKLKNKNLQLKNDILNNIITLKLCNTIYDNYILQIHINYKKYKSQICFDFVNYKNNHILYINKYFHFSHKCYFTYYSSNEINHKGILQIISSII